MPDNPTIAMALVLVAYLLGNISPSILLAKAKGIDIKQAGSGNAGTTNALRVLGKKAAVITLIVDILKGSLALLPATLLQDQTTAMICVLAVFCGHVWPVLYNFKGGKGVATAFGALLSLNPILGLSALAVVLAATLLSRRMSVGSLAGALSFPLLTYLIIPPFLPLGSLMAALIILKHRANIQRLLRGQEPKMNFHKKKEEE